jgi:hypothetical protein
MAADSLSALGADLRLAGLLAIAGCIVLFLASLRYRRRKPTAGVPRKRARPAASAHPHSHTSRVPDRSPRPNSPTIESEPIATSVRPLAPRLRVDEQHRLDALLEEHGFKGAGQRMQSNLRLWFADSAIDHQICQLASDDLIVERSGKLGGEQVSHTLWTRTGVYAVLALDGSTDDLATVDAIVRNLPTVEEIVRDLRSWISSEVQYDAKVVFLCPYTNEPPRVWYGTTGAEAWLIGGIGQLEEWLASQPGPRVDRQVLAWLREKQKPREVRPGPSITAPADTRRG